MSVAATRLCNGARETVQLSFIAPWMQKQDQECWRLASSRTTLFNSKLDGFGRTARGQGLSLERELLIRSLQIGHRESARHSVERAFKLFFFFSL